MLVIERSSVNADKIFSLEALEIEQYLLANSDWAIDQRLQSRHLTRCLASLIVTGWLALAEIANVGNQISIMQESQGATIRTSSLNQFCFIAFVLFHLDHFVEVVFENNIFSLISRSNLIPLLKEDIETHLYL